MRQSRSRWLLHEPAPDRPLLFAFPFAGAGAASLRNWPGRIGDYEVHPVQLPGREYRIKEPAYQDFASFAVDAYDELGDYFDRPYALVGHCMGALLAHALAGQAIDAGGAAPERLIVSASQAPFRGFHGFYHPWMSDARITGELRRVAKESGSGDIPDELLPLAARVVREDVRMCLGHAPAAKPLDIPITAVGWEDDVDVAEEDLAQWQEYGPARSHLLPGDPVRFLAAPRALVQLIEDELTS